MNAGRARAASGGFVAIESGEGTQTSSGKVFIRTANGGAAGTSGRLAFSSGTSKVGNSGALLLGTGGGHRRGGWSYHCGCRERNQRHWWRTYSGGGDAVL